MMISVHTAAEPSNASLHWGFKKSSNGQPADAGSFYERILEKHGAVYKGDPSKKDIYLTFDNGYENGYTKQILAVLKKHNVPATFFVTGHYLDSASDITKQMVKEGHSIGNHSWSHPDMTQISDAQIEKELALIKEETERLTGQKNMAYLRPPRGIFSERTMAVAKRLGYTHVFWSLAYVDWYVDRQRGPQFAHDQVMKQIHPGAILLLHTISKDNAEALESIIVDLKKQGYHFKSIDDLMNSKKPNNKVNQ
nr:delta-lactam-biosynthetic de-N-acetylase [Peribacillus saganii]